MTKVKITTTLGTMVAELYEDKAPITVANFLSYVDKGFYNETIFHRVIENFMIQGGGFTVDMSQKATDAPIKNEAANGLANDRGTLAMARTMVVDSATCQFFIVHKDSEFLNTNYAAFGEVTEGMEYVDKIAQTQTDENDWPIENQIIKTIRILNGEEEK